MRRRVGLVFLFVAHLACAREPNAMLDGLPPAPDASTPAPAECAISFFPSALELGPVTRGTKITRAFRIQNESDAACVLESLRAERGAPQLALAPLSLPVTIAPRDRLFSAINLAPDQLGPFRGLGVATISNGDRLELPVTAEVTDAVLEVSPDVLVIEAFFGCAARGAVRLTNLGSGEVGIRAAITRGGDAFALIGNAERTIGAGATENLEIEYVAISEEDVEGTLAIEPRDAIDGFAPVAVTLRGRGVHGERLQDMDTQLGPPPVDVLVVIDNSPSMAEELAHVALNVHNLLVGTPLFDSDPRLAITTTDVSASGARGRLLPLGAPRVLTSTASIADIEAILPLPNGSTNTQGLEAMALAYEEPLNAGFERFQAYRMALFISANDDLSPEPVQDYVDVFGEKLPALYALSAAIGGEGGCVGPVGSAIEGTRYLDAVRIGGGELQSICDTDWFWNFTAFEYKSRFFLSNMPWPPSIEVSVDGVRVEPINERGLVIWAYDAATNSINFSPYGIPLPGADLLFTYELGCVP
jgi:hypothetical protein